MNEIKNSKSYFIIGGLVISLTFLVLVSPTNVFATEFTQEITYDPTPDKPNSGDECKIVIKTPGDSTKEQTDVNMTKNLIENALNISDDMETKVGDACAKQKKTITIIIERDSMLVNAHADKKSGEIRIDPGDVERSLSHITGDVGAIKYFMANRLIGIIAHEFEHLRGGPGDDSHDDPTIHGPGVKGPAVIDQNAVWEDLKINITRNEYGTLEFQNNKTFSVVFFNVTNHILKLNVTGFIFDPLNRSDKSWEMTLDDLPAPSPMEEIPRQPCDKEKNLPCWELPLNDKDLDSILDMEDNCPSVVNPKQLDSDGNGVGQGCDPKGEDKSTSKDKEKKVPIGKGADDKEQKPPGKEKESKGKGPKGVEQQGIINPSGNYLPPIKQMKIGITSEKVLCNEGKQLIFKSSDGSPKCVSMVAAEKLVERGWATR